MAAAIKKVESKPRLTAHELLGSISYWGTAARLVLVGVLLAVIYFVNISVVTTWQAVDLETMLFIYGLGTIVVLDAGYVMTAKALKLNKTVDRWVLTLSDLVIAGFFIAPSIISVGSYTTQLRVIMLVVALFIVSIRILVGLLFARKK